MVLPISGFTAIPNPQMLAFMGAQSFIMMYQAGEGWQYGKRRQSAMSNEEFNKQTPVSIMERQRQELGKAIPSIEKSMNQMSPMIATIVKQYGDFLSQAIQATPEAIGNAFEGLEQTGYNLRSELGIPKHGLVADSSGNFPDVTSSIANFFNSFATIPQAFATRNTSSQHEGLQESQKIDESPIVTLGNIISKTGTTQTATQGPNQPLLYNVEDNKIKTSGTANRKVITFTYSKVSGLKTAGTKTQTYVFNEAGHWRKFKSIDTTRRQTANRDTKKTLLFMLRAYDKAITQAFS